MASAVNMLWRLWSQNQLKSQVRNAQTWFPLALFSPSYSSLSTLSLHIPNYSMFNREETTKQNKASLLSQSVFCCCNWAPDRVICTANKLISLSFRVWEVQGWGATSNNSLLSGGDAAVSQWQMPSQSEIKQACHRASISNKPLHQQSMNQEMCSAIEKAKLSWLTCPSPRDLTP